MIPLSLLVLLYGLCDLRQTARRLRFILACRQGGMLVAGEN